MKEIFVLAEHRQGILREITFELLLLADKMVQDHDLTVSIVLIGQDTSSFEQALTGTCDDLIVINDDVFLNYTADAYLTALEKLILDRKPVLTLIGHTSTGMDLAPVLAARMDTAFVSDCVSLAFEGDTLHADRQIYGGKINSHLILKPADHYIASIRPGSMNPLEDNDKKTITTQIDVPEMPDSLRRRFMEYIEAATEDVDIAAADILVSVGRGIGKPENLSIADAFAKKIGATLSCSRPVADEGWLPKSRQVGISGKTVKPKVYIALGISGAFQHQAGMKNAQTIIAVNTDPAAPIFSVAHYGIIGDVMEVLPELNKTIA
ncbi:MAG: electron transfer flavoprotein subunit alpha/FixB family protein [Desulfobacula sp.]|nr:electron transfer flavoprotein subunit alpha/FixB family protein [Desulfobacula sp.]